MKALTGTVVLLILPALAGCFSARYPSSRGTSSSRLPALWTADDIDNIHSSTPYFLKQQTIKEKLLATALAGCIAVTATFPGVALAVSGGGLDFAGLDISGQDFSKQNFKGKDFTQVLAKKTTFAGSNLQGCRFYKAYLVQADFTGADMRGASLEDTSMDEADLQNVVAAGAYFSRSILDVKNLANIDLTDAQVPVKALPMLCDRSDLKGTNPVTGVDTRESIMCP